MSYDSPAVKALHKACFSGKRKAVRPLLAADASLVHATRSDGLSCLHIAANGGHSKLCRLLLDAGAALEARESHGASPLSIAAQQGSASVVRLLLARGAAPNSRRLDGVPPLYIAAQEGHAKVVAALVEGGAELDAALASGATALYIAAQKGHDKVVAVLLDRGASTAVRVDSVTPLEVAVRHHHVICMDLLIRAGGTVLKRGPPIGPPAVGIAALKRLDDMQAELVEVLHKTPVKSNSINKDPEGRPLLDRTKLKKKDVEKLSKKEMTESYKQCVSSLAKLGDQLSALRVSLVADLEETQKELNAWKSAYLLLQERGKTNAPSNSPAMPPIEVSEDSSSHKEHIM